MYLTIIVSNDAPIQFFDFPISIVCMPQQIAGNPKIHRNDNKTQEN